MIIQKRQSLNTLSFYDASSFLCKEKYLLIGIRIINIRSVYDGSKTKFSTMKKNITY